MAGNKPKAKDERGPVFRPRASGYRAGRPRGGDGVHEVVPSDPGAGQAGGAWRQVLGGLLTTAMGVRPATVGRVLAAGPRRCSNRSRGRVARSGADLGRADRRTREFGEEMAWDLPQDFYARGDSGGNEPGWMDKVARDRARRVGR